MQFNEQLLHQSLVSHDLIKCFWGNGDGYVSLPSNVKGEEVLEQ